jgi:uncharacterized protein YndB with AHSA1/START domain
LSTLPSRPGSGSPRVAGGWTFTPRPDGTTFVEITNSGFSGSGDEVVQKALDSTQGFALVLSGAKALLEHDLRLNLVGDRFPKDLET